MPPPFSAPGFVIAPPYWRPRSSLYPPVIVRPVSVTFDSWSTRTLPGLPAVFAPLSVGVPEPLLACPTIVRSLAIAVSPTQVPLTVSLFPASAAFTASCRVEKVLCARAFVTAHAGWVASAPGAITPPGPRIAAADAATKRALPFSTLRSDLAGRDPRLPELLAIPIVPPPSRTRQVTGTRALYRIAQVWGEWGVGGRERLYVERDLA